MLETTKVFADKGLTVKALAQAVRGTPVYSVEAAYEPAQVVGLKATLVSECKTPESGQIDTNKLTVLYKRADFTVEETIAYSKSKLSFATSFSLAHQAIRAGAQVLSSFAAGAEGDKKFKLDGYAVKLGYVPTSALALVANYEQAAAASAGATLYYKKDVTETAAQVTLDPQNPSKTPAFAFAVSHAYDVKTTLKARATTANNAVAFSLRHQLTPALSVTLATETVGCPAKDAAKPAVTKHGIAINLKL